MKEAIPDQLLEIAGGTDLGHSTGIDLRRHQGLTVIHLDPGQVIETEHPAGAEFPDHARNPDTLIVEELLAEPGCVLGLNPKIEFPKQNPATLACHRRPIPSSPPARMALKHGRHLLHHLQIKAKQRLKTRSLHFQHYLATAPQAGAMHLSQGCGAQRLRIEIDHFGTSLPKLLLKHRLNAIKPEGGDAVLKSREFLHPARRKNVGARRQQLAKLDEGRAQPDQFPSQPAGSQRLANRPLFRGRFTSIGPTLAIPPQQKQQGENGPPDRQSTHHPGQSSQPLRQEHQERTSSCWLISATFARNRSMIS